MGIWQNITSLFGGGIDRRSMPLSRLTPDFFGDHIESHAGINVSPETAMAAAAVYACVGVISSTVAALPVDVVKLDGTGQVAGHPANLLFDGEPNSEMTSTTFRETLMVNALLWGNAYAYIERDDFGLPVALWPLRSASTWVERSPGGAVAYRTTTDGKAFTFGAADVLHVLNMGFDGRVGVSPIQYARNPIGLALAMERFGAKFFSNGANIGGIVELPAGMKHEAVNAFRDSWRKTYSGGENSLKTALLTDGMKFTKTATDPESAQMVDTRAFQVREIARIYRVPLHKIGDLERATFSNIEHQAIEFVQDCITPWVVRWEQEARRKLFTEAEKPALRVRFNLDGLLRGDTAARYAAYTAGRMGGWLTVNDIRRDEGKSPVEGGDVLLSPLNMTQVGKPAAEKPAA